MRVASLLLVSMIAFASVSGARAAEPCERLDWTKMELPMSKRPLQAEDLLRLRDIGPAGDDGPTHIMTLSPDKSLVALQVRQANLQSNSYCLGMVVVPLDGTARPLFVDKGGEYMLAPAGDETLPATSTGLARTITPRWSPNGTWFAFLKRVKGITQVWRADIATARSYPIAPPNAEVNDFRVVDDAQVVVRIHPPTHDLSSTLVDEAKFGFHFDRRFVPMQSDRPIVPVTGAIRYMTTEIATGRTRVAEQSEISLFDALEEPRPSHNSDGGQSCTLSRRPVEPGVTAATGLEIACPGRPPLLCNDDACIDTAGAMWWVPGGIRVRFLKREGWARTQTALYEWDVTEGRVRRLYATQALLVDCQPRNQGELICLRETSLRPRALVSIAVANGREREIANFNPEFNHLMLGSVERLRLTSDAGIDTFADVVYPVGYHPGRRYPLIVVQYQSRGFLRGGTGDEFPIQAFANAGFAVLSVQRPIAFGSLAKPTDYIEMDRLNLVDFADRRNVLSVIERGVGELVRRGVVDNGAVGITGLSDGSSTVQFASLNSRLFSAGIVSGCCWERGQTALLGPRVAERYARIGWPGVSEDASEFWAHISLAQNARRVAFPILFEMADEEFRAALESYTALREVGKAADLFVFPDEYHIKWQPAHRLAAYQRGIDWFMYWLRGLRPHDPRRLAEVERWAAMDQTRLN